MSVDAAYEVGALPSVALGPGTSTIPDEPAVAAGAKATCGTVTVVAITCVVKDEGMAWPAEEPLE